MREKQLEMFRSKMKDSCFEKIEKIHNSRLFDFLADAIQLCEPDEVFVCSDSEDDIAYIRRRAVETGEEKPLAMEGHTIHFDGFNDQGRDPENTKYLVPEGMDLGKRLRQMNRQQGLDEIRGLLKGIMKGREMIVRFFCLGPVDSEFSISGMQVTDSYYVGHSCDLLYRAGFEQFLKLGDSGDFFCVMHSSGELNPDMTSKNIDKRRIYIDIEADTVYTVNTQYAGNTIGFKKLALRLAIRKADREGWLAEHMFVMGAHGPNDRVTYFTGAFPSFCGKTSTAMIPGETIVGDDLAYLRVRDGKVYAANVECGLFGIIQDVNIDDDPTTWKAITTPGEVIFSNVLINDGIPYWTGDGREQPDTGVNHSGDWYHGKKDANGKEIPLSHKNSRLTIKLNKLDTLDPMADHPDGVPVGGVIYGGRNSYTWVPVQQAFTWNHGVILVAASLESETTAATIGEEGVRKFQPMSNLDFVSIPIGRYIMNHLKFMENVNDQPHIFAVNYFLKDKNGRYLNGISDKYVWIKWMELRCHGDVKAIVSPTGYIPKYKDLKSLFKTVLKKKFTKEDYISQFKFRVPRNLDKMIRIEEIFKEQVTDTPQIVFDYIAKQRDFIIKLEEKLGEYISPFDLEELKLKPPF